MTNETALTIPLSPAEWSLPSRRKVAVACLIATESALFTIFVVAYLFYLGKSLTALIRRRSWRRRSSRRSVCSRAA